MDGRTDGRTDGIAMAYTRYSIYAVARKNWGHTYDEGLLWFFVFFFVN